jgi:MFS family permease
VLTLVAWGAATDRWGERRVVLVGLVATTAAAGLSTLAGGTVALTLALVLSGAMSACTNSASGRLIAGWFPPERRGLAMGIRQTCQPIGIAVASLAVPPLAAGGGIGAALAFGGLLTLVSLAVCAFVVVDPKRGPRAAGAATDSNSYRGSTVLQRIHLVSILLVVPQFALSTFGLVWVTLGFGWSALAAGAVVAVAQLIGAAGRIAVGVWSDRVLSRLRPLRQVALIGVVTMLLTAAFGWVDWGVPAAIAYVIASCVSVADNGLAFTAVAEIAGPGWAGRALGVQNTGQFVAAAAVGPAVGGLIALVGIPAAFAFVALAPALAAPLVPGGRAERAR